MTSAISWIKADETAMHAFARILTERPFLVLPPPLHRLPLRAGNIVEIVGPSPSAKTLVLIQAAINCILPKEWEGVQYGGLERSVMFVDLDCRFDVLSFSRALQRRIIGITGLSGSMKGNENQFDKDLFAACMRRFLYIRCYNSFEFLATLKTLHDRIQKEKEKQGGSVYMLMIDSIGAFYWMDRALPSLSIGNNRKNLSLQTVVQTIVQDIRKLLLVHPMLVLATKSTTFGDKQSTSEMMRFVKEKGPTIRCSIQEDLGLNHIATSCLLFGRCNLLPSPLCLRLSIFPNKQSRKIFYITQLLLLKITNNLENLVLLQSFISHRILLRASDEVRRHQIAPTFTTEWLLPSLQFSDQFTVNDDGLLVAV